MNQSKYKEPKRGSEEINEDWPAGGFRKQKSNKGKRRKLTLHDRRKGGTKRYL